MTTLKLKEIIISSQKFAELDGSDLVTRLMLFTNDLSTVEFFDQQLREVETAGESPAFIDGAGSYLVRLHCSHLREALKLVEEINQNQTLLSFLISKEAKDAFDRLLRYGPKKLPDKTKAEQFELVKRIRDNGTFHAIEKEHVKEVLQQLKVIPHISAFVSGMRKSTGRFKMADEVYRWIFIQYIMETPLDSVAATADAQIPLIGVEYEKLTEVICELKKDFYLVAETIAAKAIERCLI